MDEDTEMYYSQLFRKLKRPPTTDELEAYFTAHGAEVERRGHTFYVTWPPGTGFYE